MGGSDKGLSGKIRKWLLIVLGNLFVLAMVYAYFVNLPTMNVGLAIALPIFAILFSGIGCAPYFAFRSNAEQTDKD